MTPAQLDDIRARNPVDVLARQWVKLRRGGKLGLIGPCPICSQNTESAKATKFECNAEKWLCIVCPGGGDVIALVQQREGLSFADACQSLGGSAVIGETPVTAKRAGAKDYRASAQDVAAPVIIPALYAGDLAAPYMDGWRGAHQAAQSAIAFRERERARLHRFYLQAARLHNSPAIVYLRGRGYDVPPHAKLRGHSSFPMFADGRENEPRLLHRGPAMLAPIAGPSGVFSGLHVTWLDPAQPKGKAAIIDPQSGEVMPAKKARGTKAGGYIDLGYVGDTPGARMFAGEGIETVLAAFTALNRAGALRDGDRFRSAIDLGNLAGKAAAQIDHPTLKTEKGRARRVGGPLPDLSSAAMPVPDDVSELVIIADGDSEPILTRNAIARCEARHSRPGRIVRAVWPTAG